ncbi:MAG: acetyl-CoA carboxylase biotin carboxyl carrier protein [Ignavibacteria bacterium]|jgi:acetyl-CoA carboxylase biotin carboxyl carrier protein|nr:acetyl-CoA carboxylase biotin carboxyl carrier protein [Ignavibacteria bacterium]MDH7527073.1 acetyl-CoA carboxylase biotin carboxyl carrier protein [Ignavibacteria bacterium]NPV10782.1 acetyl-CoA carboxylase biotin carboxyl carrier protein [Ignavibacteria bacterium]
MDLNYLKKLLKIVDDSGVDEVEIEEEGTRIKIKKSPTYKSDSQNVYPYVFPQNFQIPVQPPVTQTQVQIPQAAVTEEKKAVEEKKPEKKYHEIKSPIVGTFYRAPSPDAEPYVKVGDTVQVGQVLCIVEAMKLMNEIESDVNGKIVQILVENAQPVEYGQTLFLIEPL